MFDFEKLLVYKKSKTFNKDVLVILEGKNVHSVNSNQFRRASLSIMLNIAEGSGRFSNADKRRFYVIARGSAFECVAMIDYLKDIGTIDNGVYLKMYTRLDEISRMLYSLIKQLSR